jgi:hypothetical protein
MGGKTVKLETKPLGLVELKSALDNSLRGLLNGTMNTNLAGSINANVSGQCRLLTLALRMHASRTSPQRLLAAPSARK